MESASLNKENGSLADREIVVSRLMNVPRELVWKAWTDPKHITHWWGPNGFSTTTKEFNFKPGGIWRFTMHGPDGRDYPNRIVFTDIKEPEHIAYKHTGEEDFDDVVFEANVTMEAMHGKTKITLRSIFPTAQARDYVVKEFGAIEGAQQTLERFEAFVTASLAKSI